VTDYLPDAYVRFREAYPSVASALDALGSACDDAGPLDDGTERLVKLGIAVGALAEGAVRSNARKALAAGATPEAIRHVGVLGITTVGFPAAIAGLAWIEEVLGAEA
jgi:4-carboxymuconolactone decarboxylase